MIDNKLDTTVNDYQDDELELEIKATEEAVTDAQPPMNISRALVAADTLDWQKLWLETQRRPWRSLAVVPACSSVNALEIARVLTILGRRHLGRRFLVADATQLSLRRLEDLKAVIRTRIEQDKCVIIATRPIAESAACLAIARSADAVLLTVVLGETSIKATNEVINDIGAERFLGSVIVGPSPKSES